MQKVLKVLLALVLSMFLHLSILQARFETEQSQTSGVIPTEIGLVQIESPADSPLNKLNDVSAAIPQENERQSEPHSVKAVPDQVESRSVLTSVKEPSFLPVEPIENTSLISKVLRKTKTKVKAEEKNSRELLEDISEQTTKQKVVKKIEASTSPDNSFPNQLPETNRVIPPGQLPDKIKISSLINKEGTLDSQIAIPRYEDNPAPVYPDIALRKGWEGLVLLRVSVKKNGLVGQINIEESSGFRSLDRAALKTVRRWKFVPAKSSGIPVDGGALVPINFRLP